MDKVIDVPFQFPTLTNFYPFLFPRKHPYKHFNHWILLRRHSVLLDAITLTSHDATIVTGQVMFPVRRVCSQEDAVKAALELWGYQEAQSRANTSVLIQGN